MNTITSAIYKLFFKKDSLRQKTKKWLVHIKFMAFFFKGFLNVNHFLQSLLNLLQYCVCFMFWPQGMWDLSYLTRDQTHIPCTRLNHWTTREIPNSWLLLIKINQSLYGNSRLRLNPNAIIWMKVPQNPSMNSSMHTTSKQVSKRKQPMYFTNIYGSSVKLFKE